MRICKEICKDCDMECWFFMNADNRAFYLLCTQKPFLSKWPAFLEDSFYTCFRISTHYIRHIGKEYRTKDSERYGYGHGFTRDKPWLDEYQYRYDGWNPFKRFKAFCSKRMVDSYWNLLEESRQDTIVIPSNFCCPYEMEHKIAEWSKEGRE
jgi:hypothetical protein